MGEVVYSDEWIAQMRLGYRCLNCLHGFQESGHGAFPEKCHVCGYLVRRDQIADFSREFAGSTQIGPTGGREGQTRRDEERKARAAEQGLWTP